MSYDLAPEFSTGQSDPARPTSASPAYPTSGSPSFPPAGAQLPPQSYPGPSYPPAGFQPPAAFQPPVGGFPPGGLPPGGVPLQQPRKRSALGIVLGVVIGVLVLCGVLSCVFAFPVISQAGTTVSAPDTLPGGFTKDTSESMQAVLNSAERQLKTDISADTTAAGFYNNGDGHQALVIAASALILFPSSEVDDAFNSFGSEAKFDDVGEYSAGSLGGSVKCGAGKLDNVDMTMCAWADHGSAGIVLFVGPDMAKSAELFIPIREAVERR
jgi:hypothetical protein